MKILHFGFLTADIDKSIQSFSALGYNLQEQYEDHERNVYLAFIKSNSGESIELIQPINEKSVVSNLMNRYKNNIYHVCYETQDIQETINLLKKEGYMVIDPPKPAIAFNQNKIAFLFSKYAGMIELVENTAT